MMRFKKLFVVYIICILSVFIGSAGAYANAGAAVSPPNSVDFIMGEPKAIIKNESQTRYLSMTFDDCPFGNTEEILDVLKEYDMHATFFILGVYAQENPDILKRIADEGHTLANHTFDHKMITKLTPEQVEWEIKITEDLIFNITGVRTVLFRPPYGFIDNSQIDLVSRLGYSTVLWSVDTLDYVSTGNSICAAETAGPGDIVLFHTKGSTGKSIEAICKYYQEHNLRSVPVEQLLAMTFSDIDSGGSLTSAEYTPDK